MPNYLSNEIRKYYKHTNELKHLLNDTKQIFEDVGLQNFFHEDIMEDEIIPSLTLWRIEQSFDKSPAIIVFGQNSKAKAQFINVLLEPNILPVVNDRRRWIKFEYSAVTSVNLTRGFQQEDTDKIRKTKHSRKIPEYLLISRKELSISKYDNPACPTIINVNLNHSVLREIPVFITADNRAVNNFAESNLNILPLFVYVLDDQPLSKENIKELCELKEKFPCYPILFLSSTLYLSGSNKYSAQCKCSISSANVCLGKHDKDSVEMIWMEQLQTLGLLQTNNALNSEIYNQYINVNSLHNVTDKRNIIFKYLMDILRIPISDTISYLNKILSTVLQKLITSKLNEDKEIPVITRRIKYAIKTEHELYKKLLYIVKNDDQRLTILVRNIINEMKVNVHNTDGNWFQYSCMLFEEDEEHKWYAILRAATAEVQSKIFCELKYRISDYILASVNALQQTFSTTLYNCLIKIEETIRINNYPSPVNALNELFGAASDIEIENSHPSLMNSLMSTLTHLLVLILPPAVPKIHGSWQNKLKMDILSSLSPESLVKTLCLHYKRKMKTAHEKFLTVLRFISNNLDNIFKQIENERLIVYNMHAMKLAKLTLQCISLNNLIRHGLPKCGGVIGKGRFGFVHSSESWGDAPSNCAVKIITFSNEKYWNNFSIKFYKKLNLDHERIIKLRGFIVEQNYTTFHGHRIRLIMDQMLYDLYSALGQMLPLMNRIQIAIDVTEGIKYIHSLGLLHSNINLKNVLLDYDYRAKLNISLDINNETNFYENLLLEGDTNLPIHMAPELKTNIYNYKVDIYSFGILFWFLCAGHVDPPQTYDQFKNVYDMWKGVSRGIRPEKHLHFNSDCWNLMEQCWNSEPSQRPLPNTIISTLKYVQKKIKLGQFIISSETYKYDEIINREHKRKSYKSKSILKTFYNKMSSIYKKYK